MGEAGIGQGLRPAARLRRWLPLAVLLAMTAGFIILGLDRYADIGALATHRAALADWVAQSGPLAGAVYILVYVAAAMLSLPVAMILTLSGGLLFGPLWGGLAALTGSTLGATAVFLVVRGGGGAGVRRRAGPLVQRLEAGFRADAFSYLLVLRLLPILPYWLLNLAAALLGVPFRLFVLTSFLGLLPTSFLYASLGAGLGDMLATGQRPDLSLLHRPQILLPLLGLAVLALLPMLVKRLRR